MIRRFAVRLTGMVEVGLRVLEEGVVVVVKGPRMAGGGIFLLQS